MNIDNTEYLFKNFDFWASRESPMHSAMFFGFQCDNGWSTIMRRLCEDLKGLGLHKDNFQVTTVKEQYGELYFYWYMTSNPNPFWGTKVGESIWHKVWHKTPVRQIRRICTCLRRVIIGKNLYEKTSELIDAACELSLKICEICGTPGELRGRGSKEHPWYKTLCNTCRDREGYDDICDIFDDGGL